MARSRNIKPGLFKNEILGVADPNFTLAFQGLWLLADREGRLEDRSLRIKAEIFPYRDIDIEAALNWLQTEGFITRYEDGKNRYIQIINFSKHQNPHKNEAPSTIPVPKVEVDTNTDKIGTSTEEIGSTRADSLLLIPDSISSDSLLHTSYVAVATGAELFSRGLEILTKRVVKETNARSFLGLMRKQVGDIKAMELLLMVDEQDISNPIAWLTKVMDNKEKGNGYKSQRDKVAETGAALTGRGCSERVIDGSAVAVN